MAATALAETPENATGASALLEAPTPYRMTVDQYFRLAASGVIPEDKRIYLWKGQLVQTMPPGPLHCYSQIALAALLGRLIAADLHVRQAFPVRVGDDSVPEPDLSVVRGTMLDFRTKTPTAQDVALAVEVSDSSVAFDSLAKLAAYAEALIPVYWIVNVPAGRVEVYSDPTGPAEAPTYRNSRQYKAGEEAPVVLDGREVGRVAVGDVL